MNTTQDHKRPTFLLFILLLLAAQTATSCERTNPRDSLPSVNSPDTTTPTGEKSDPATANININRWNPSISDRLQIQFSGDTIDLSQDVEIYDLDLFETDPETIRAIHEQGKRVICYLNAGAWEEWRPDAKAFPPAILGSDYAGWPGEKWVDIRQLETLGPILSARFDMCKEKGFDGVEPDNLDAYQTESGFPLSARDQLTFNHWLAGQAHQRGLSIALKNDPDQMKELEPDFDFVVAEDCFQYGFCDQTLPFIKNDKPVFAVEYTDNWRTLTPFCDRAANLGITVFLKNRELDAYRETCP